MIMNREEAQEYIETKIPITKHMGMEIKELSRESVRVGLPLEPNLNHHDSAFGGSIESLFFVTGWCLVQYLIEDFDPEPVIVGRRGRVSFTGAIRQDFDAQLHIPGEEEIKEFLSDLKTRGKARITAKAFIEIEGKTCAEFEGDFVVLAK